MMWTKKLLELMIDGFIHDESFIHGPVRRLIDNNLPEKLYKFRAINDYAISNFESDTVWFCSADKFNDPYECATADPLMDPRLKEFLEDMNVTLRHALCRDSPDWGGSEGIDIEEAINKLNIAFSIYGDKLFQSLQNFSNEVARQRIKVCSFSSRLDSVVMWGHYAKSHTGFAIEYDVTSWDRGNKEILFPVIYQNELFDLSDYLQQATTTDARPYRSSIPYIMAAMHKSLDWSYENEWRFIWMMSEASPDENYSVPKPSAVYVGSRIIPADKERICEIASRKMIPVYQMSLSAREHKMVPHETSVKSPTLDDRLKRIVDWRIL